MVFDSPRLEGWLVRLGVPHLFANLPLLLNSALFFFAMQIASAYWFPRLLPKQFAKLSPRTRNDWDLHFVGWVHGLISTPIALYFILHPSKELVLDPIYGWSPREGIMFAVSGGYFLYDLVISLYLVRSQGVAFLVHATACCFIFFKGFTPLLNGFSAHFLVWEFSTLFLHPHWFMDKLDLTGSTAQLVNGVALILAFLSSRIIYGGYMTLVLWRALDEPHVPTNLRWGFRAANVALTCLNWSWLRLMVLSIAKRFRAREEIDAAGSKDEKKKVRRTGSNDEDVPPEM